MNQIVKYEKKGVIFFSQLVFAILGLDKFCNLICIVLWLKFLDLFSSVVISNLKSTKQGGRADVLDEAHQEVFPTSLNVIFWEVPPPLQIAKKGVKWVQGNICCKVDINCTPKEVAWVHYWKW